MRNYILHDFAITKTKSAKSEKNRRVRLTITLRARIPIYCFVFLCFLSTGRRVHSIRGCTAKAVVCTRPPLKLSARAVLQRVSVRPNFSRNQSVFGLLARTCCCYHRGTRRKKPGKITVFRQTEKNVFHNLKTGDDDWFFFARFGPS